MNKLIVACVVLALTGCNTVAGFGKDLQTVGGVVAGTATGVQKGATTPGEPVAAPANCQPDANGLVLEACPAMQ